MWHIMRHMHISYAVYAPPICGICAADMRIIRRGRTIAHNSRLCAGLCGVCSKCGLGMRFVMRVMRLASAVYAEVCVHRVNMKVNPTSNSYSRGSK